MAGLWGNASCNAPCFRGQPKVGATICPSFAACRVYHESLLSFLTARCNPLQAAYARPMHRLETVVKTCAHVQVIKLNLFRAKGVFSIADVNSEVLIFWSPARP